MAGRDDPQAPLSEKELAALREIIKEAEHATWLRKMALVVVPVVFTVVSAVVAAGTWVANHLTFKP